MRTGQPGFTLALMFRKLHAGTEPSEIAGFDERQIRKLGKISRAIREKEKDSINWINRSKQPGIGPPLRSPWACDVDRSRPAARIAIDEALKTCNRQRVAW